MLEGGHWMARLWEVGGKAVLVWGMFHIGFGLKRQKEWSKLHWGHRLCFWCLRDSTGGCGGTQGHPKSSVQATCPQAGLCVSAMPPVVLPMTPIGLC